MALVFAMAPQGAVFAAETKGGIAPLAAGTWTATANVNLTVAPTVWDGSQIVITGAGQTATSVSFTVAGLPVDGTAQVTATAEVSVDGGVFATVTPEGGVYTIGGLSSGTKHVIRVRAKADTNHRASDAVSASLPTAYATPDPQAVLTILYAQEVVQFASGELPSNYSLKLNGQTVSNNASLSAAAEAAGTGTFTLALTRVGPDATIPASGEATLTVTGKGPAPVLGDTADGVVVTKTTQDDSGDGYISYYAGSAPAAFEYRPSGSADVTSGWVSAPTGATAHSLPLGNFDVRLPATSAAFASKILTVAVQSANASTYLDMNGGGASATLKNAGSVVWTAAGAGIWKAKYDDYQNPALPTAAWTGHVFGGWYRDKAGNDGPVTTSAGTGDNSVTYYAKWTDFTLAKAGASVRTGDAAATVKFSSTVSGTYYFAVTAGSAGAPALDTGGAGVALTAGQTVTLALTDVDGMAAGALAFYVQAKDAQGNLSNRLKIDLPEYSAPAVTGISVTEAVASGGNAYVPLSGTLKVAFDQAVDTAATQAVTLGLDPRVQGVEIELDVASGTWNNAKTELSIAYAGLAYGTVYDVKIAGFEDEDGNEMAPFDGGAELAPACGHLTAFSAPAAPTGFSAAHASATSALLTWTAPADFGGTSVTGYEYKVDSGAWTAIPSSASATSYTVTGLAPKTARTFSLRAANAAGKGADTTDSLAAVTFTGTAVTLVNGQAGTTPVYGTPVTARLDGAVTVPADQDLGALSYVWKRHDGAGDADGTVIGGATGASYTPVAADIGKLLTVTVSAANAEGAAASAQTSEVSRRALTITAQAADKPYDGTTDAAVGSWSWADGPVSGDESGVTVKAGTAVFDRAGSADADTVATAQFSGFSLEGAKADCYTLANPQDSTAKITKGFDAAAGAQYALTALNGAGWTNAAAFSVAAKSGFAVSLSATAEGPWTDTLSLGEAETAAGAQDFYVRNTATGAISRAEGASWKLDRTAPAAEVTIRDNAFKQFLNAITFGYFFKNTTDVKVKGTDALSGVAKTEYLQADATYGSTEDALAAAGWTTGAGFSVAPGWKGVVYGRVTDAAGNVTVVNSQGVVIYQDSASSSSVTYTRTTKAAKSFDVVLHGNEIESVSVDSAPLSLNNQYTVDVSGDVATVTLSGDYLETLAADEYVISVAVKPLGQAYVSDNGGEGDENDAPAAVTVALTVQKKAVADADVTWPAAAGVTYGDALAQATPSGGSAPGGATWTWDAPTAKPTVGNAGYALTLVPSGAALEKYDYSQVTMTRNTVVPVTPRKLTGATGGGTVNGFAAAGKTYDGSDAAAVTFTPDNLVEGDLAQNVVGAAHAHYASGANAGANKTVDIDSLGLLSANYALPDFPVSLKATIAKAPAVGVAQEIQAAESDGDVSYELSPVGLVLPALADGLSYGTVVYALGTVTDSDTILADAGVAYDADAGTVTATVKGGATAGHEATAEILVTTANYEFASPVILTVRVVGSAPRVQPGGPVGASVFTGDAVTLSATAAQSGLAGTWAWWKSTNDARGDDDDEAVAGATGAIVADGGATVATFAAPTDAAGTAWYYCAFTNDVGTSYSALAKVDVTARTYTATLSPAAKDFGSAAYGYPAQGGQAFVLKNTGNQALKGLSVSLGDAAASAFEIAEVVDSVGGRQDAAPTALGVGESVSVTVRPKSGLDARAAAYEDTLTFSWTDGGVSGAGAGSLSSAATLTFAVGKTAGAVTLADPDAQAALVYNGSAVVPAVTANAAAADAGTDLTAGLTWHWRADAGNASAGTAPYTVAASAADLPKDAGVWQAYASTAESGNHLAAESGVVTYTIARKPLTITAKAQDKAYDGTKTATLADGVDAPTLVGVVAGEGALVTLSPGAVVFDGAGSPDADTVVAVKFSGFGIGGEGAANYSFTQPSDGSATIHGGFDAAADEDYTLTTLTGGYTNGVFTVTGAGGASVSLTGTADSDWTAGPLTLGADETAQGARTFYVKRADGAISRAEAVSWKIDKTAPTAQIAVKGNAFKTFVNTVTFGLFFKESVDVTITAADLGSVVAPPANSGVATVEYLLVEDDGAGAGVDGAFANEAAALTAGGWQAYSALSKPSVAPGWKGAAYARVTDVAGNTAVVNSDGVVVYTDSASSDSVAYVRTSGTAQAFDVTLHGNTIDKVYVDDSLLAGGSDYAVSVNHDVATVTLSGSRLETLAAGAYTVVVTFLPLGETYQANNAGEGGADTNEAPAAARVPLTVTKAVPEIGAITANGGTALPYGQRLSAWAVAGTAHVAAGAPNAGTAVGGSFAWADATVIPGYDRVDGTGAKISGGDSASAENGLAGDGYAFAVTWTPSDEANSYGSGKASDYFLPVTAGLTATAKVSQATPYMASGEAPQGSAINLASYGGILSDSVISGIVYYDFADNIGSGNAAGKTAVAGAWAWDAAVPADVHYSLAGIHEEPATFTPADPRVAAFHADGTDGSHAKAQVPVFSPATKIVIPSSYTLSGFYGGTLADVSVGVYGLDAYLKSLGFKAVEDGGGDLTNAQVIPGTFAWAAADPSAVALTAAGGSQAVAVRFTPDDLVDANYTPGSGFAISTADLTVTLALPALGGTVALASDAEGGAAAYGAALTASGAEKLTLTPDATATVGFGTLSYVWKRYSAAGVFETDIAGASGAGYTLTADDIGHKIGAVVTATNASGQVDSALTDAVTKAAQDAPAAPVLSEKTSRTVRVVAAAGLEYTIDGGASWVADGDAGAFTAGDGAADGFVTFSGLSPKTAYTVAARRAETTVLAASPKSAGLAVTTKRELYYSVEQVGGAAATATTTSLRIKFWSNAGLSAAEAVTGLALSNLEVSGADAALVDGSLDTPVATPAGSVWTASVGGTFADGASVTLAVSGLADTVVKTLVTDASARPQLWRDVTGPVLTAGAVNRTSDTAAAIGFTSSEAGTAYVYAAGSGADLGAVLGTGSDAAATAQAVASQGSSLGAVTSGASSGLAVALTAGAKDLYVVCVDADGNASALLKLTAAKMPATLTAAPVAKSGLIFTGAARTLVDAGAASGGTVEYAVVSGGASAPAGAAYASALPKGTSVGAYDVYYRVVGDADHGDVAAAGPVTAHIIKVPATITAAPEALNGIVYNGAPQTLTTAGTPDGGAMHFAVVASGDPMPTDDADYAAGPAKAENAGAYDVYYMVAGDGDHSDSVKGGPVNVVIAQGTQAALALGGALPTALGETRTFTVSGGSGTGDYSLASTNPAVAQVTPVNAAAGTFKVEIVANTGEYRLTYGRDADGNYTAASATSAAADTSKTAGTVTTPPTGIGGLVYNTAAQALVNAGIATGGALKYWLDDDSGIAASDVATAEWQTDVPKVTNAGNYTVWYRVFGDADHNDTLPADIPVSVAKAPTTPPPAPAGVKAAYGDALSKAALPAHWSWDEVDTTLVGAVGTQAHPATYTPDDPDNYESVSGISVDIEVGKAAPVKDGAAPAAAALTLRYGEALSAAAGAAAETIDTAGYAFVGVAADGTPALAGTVAWKTPTQTVTGTAAEAGAFVAKAVFTPSGAAAANYAALEFDVTVTVLAAQSAKTGLDDAIMAHAPVETWIANENESSGSHAGLHADDYPAGALAAFEAAAAAAKAVAQDANATQGEVQAAQQNLEKAAAALVPDHTRMQTLVGGQPADGTPTLAQPVTEDLAFEIKGHFPHVSTVTIQGATHGTETVLWAAPAGSGGDFTAKTLQDPSLGAAAGTLSSGSAIVTLPQDYLQKLAPGEHTVTVAFADRLVSAAADGTAVAEAARHKVTFVIEEATAAARVDSIRTAVSKYGVVKGRSLTIPLVVTMAEGETGAPELSWESSNPKVAQVTKLTETAVKVKGLKAGKAKITVRSADGKRKALTITVSKKKVKLTHLRAKTQKTTATTSKKTSAKKKPSSGKITVWTPKQALKVGQTTKLKISVSSIPPSMGVPKFTSSKKSVLTIDKAGYMTARKKGTATVTVKCGGKKVKVTVKVK